MDKLASFIVVCTPPLLEPQQSTMGSVYQDASGGGAPSTGSSGDDGKMIDLSLKFDTPDCYARNEATGYPMTNLFIGDTRLGCKSDTDEQLIIHISFQEFVKVRKLCLGKMIWKAATKE